MSCPPAPGGESCRGGTPVPVSRRRKLGVPMTTAHRTCPICDSVCGLKIDFDPAGRVTEVRGDAEDPFTKGYICPKGASIGRLDEDPDRLRHPMIRDGDRWREASWDEA